MQYKKLIKIVTDDYREEHFILERFPNASWTPQCGMSIFYLDENEEEEVKQAIREWKEYEKNERENRSSRKCEYQTS